MKANKFKIYDSRKGQSVVEYLLLLFVVMSLILTLVNSNVFQQIMGPDSFFFEKLKLQQEYTYRHTHLSNLPNEADYSGGAHHSYMNPESGVSRFYSTMEEYP